MQIDLSIAKQYFQILNYQKTQNKKRMRNTGLVAAVVLLGSVMLIPAFSEDNYQEKDRFGFEDSNKTMDFGDSNKTMFFDDSNQINIGHEISDYVHKRNELEKQQRDQILSAMKSCRQLAKESGNRTAMQKCTDSLKSSMEQYRSFVMQQNLQFQQFRQGVVQSHTTILPEQNKQALNQVISHITHSHAGAFSEIKNIHKNGRQP
ncbi:MAG: hypothetical protein KGI25_04095 [Thaumarchaeota archaeon]|nr:hypothetical protein [Nitrososphaerota archaeon]